MAFGTTLPTTIAWGAEMPAFFFADFEPRSGWASGSWTKDAGGLVLIQGKAAIVDDPVQGAGQVLELGPSDPYSALHADTTPLGSAPVFYCEMWVRAGAVSKESSEEFADFGGAVIAFLQ